MQPQNNNQPRNPRNIRLIKVVIGIIGIVALVLLSNHFIFSAGKTAKTSQNKSGINGQATSSSSGGQSDQDVTPKGPVPVIALSVSPTNVKANETSTLTWNAANAKSCFASGGWTGARSVSGQETTAPQGDPSLKVNYTLTCTNANGSASKTVTVTISPMPPHKDYPPGYVVP